MNALKTPAPTRATATQMCSHCGLPVPRGLIKPESSDQFCCAGCRTAFALIHEHGLNAFYKLAGGQVANRPAEPTGDRFELFDLTEFQDRFGTSINESTREIRFALDGIHCAACIWLIEKLPRIVPGVIQAQVNWARQTVRIVWQTDHVLLSQIGDTLHQLGYMPRPIRESENEVRRKQENHKHLARIGIAGAAAGNNMLIAAALYLGMFAHMSTGMSTVLRVASCVVGLVALLGPGRVFLKGAWNAIRTWTPHMDLPIALALLVGTVAGLINTILGTGEIYFDSLTVLIFLLLVGRWIQFRQQNRAADAVEMLYRLTPQKTRKMVDGQAVSTFVDLIRTGDLLEILDGDVLPVDAEIVDGQSSFDESILSGESRPVHKRIGQLVLAGTRNDGSRVIVRATKTGRETRLSKIVELVEQAALEKPRVVQWANRTGGYFVVTVIALALITFFAWLSEDVSTAVERTVALLIVACPCALAIATPLTIAVAIGRAAKRKIMIKSGDVLQSMRQPGLIWLDKTGTITTGQLDVVHWYGDRHCLNDVLALERHSSHPVARAIVEFAGSNHACTETNDVHQHPASGISGDVAGRSLVIGSEKLIRSHCAELPTKWRDQSAEILDSGMAPCWIACDGQIVAMLAIGDRIREDATDAINHLKLEGWQVGILSGDHVTIVNQVADRLGIEPDLALGGVSPEEKLRLVRKSMQQGQTVVMVGDGVNDSAALAAASVGIAVHSGAEASLAAAPVYLAEAGLNPILQLHAISRQTGRTMITNLAISLTYNITGAALAFLGFINPLVAAILMPASSLTVVGISLTNAGRVSKRDSS